MPPTGRCAGRSPGRHLGRRGRPAPAERGTRHRENFEHARLANRNPPSLQSHNVNGERIDRIEFHPSWHVLMRGIVGRGTPCRSLGGGARAAARRTRSARRVTSLQAQVECGTLCPTTMTYGALAVMQKDARLVDAWLPTLTSRDYDPRDLAIGQKRGALIGMGMTEKQGGSDVRANTTPRRSERRRQLLRDRPQMVFSPRRSATRI